MPVLCFTATIGQSFRPVRAQKAPAELTTMMAVIHFSVEGMWYCECSLTDVAHWDT